MRQQVFASLVAIAFTYIASPLILAARYGGSARCSVLSLVGSA